MKGNVQLGGFTTDNKRFKGNEILLLNACSVIFVNIQFTKQIVVVRR